MDRQQRALFYGKVCKPCCLKTTLQQLQRDAQHTHKGAMCKHMLLTLSSGSHVPSALSCSAAGCQGAALTAPAGAQVWYVAFFGSSAFVAPFINLFLERQGFKPSQIGIVAASRPWVAAVANGFWCATADRFRCHRRAPLLTAIPALIALGVQHWYRRMCAMWYLKLARHPNARHGKLHTQILAFLGVLPHT